MRNLPDKLRDADSLLATPGIGYLVLLPLRHTHAKLGTSI